MANKKEFGVNLDLNKRELLNAKVHNLTTAEIAIFAATLLTSDKGLLVYDITLLNLFIWNGILFENITPNNEQIQDAAFGILTDTPTIELNYDDNLNQVTATVIDNSIINEKLAQMPALTVIANQLPNIANAQYVGLKPALLGTTFLQPILDINLIPINSGRTITDVRITDTSNVQFSLTSNGTITSIPIRATKNNGSIFFSTGQVGDTAELDYTIIF